MHTRVIVILSAVVILLLFVASAILSPYAPEAFVSHWNAEGVPDGHISKFWGLFLLPSITLGIFLLFLVFAVIDPLKKNIALFRSWFDLSILVFICFFAYIHALTLYWNFIGPFSMNIAIAPAFSFLFIFIGILLRKTKRNWFIGIRTPWTLSSDSVWEKTHRLGSSLFIGVGILSSFGMLFPSYLFTLFFVPLIISVIFLLIYSYIAYRKEQ